MSARVYKDINEFVEALNASCDYVILRNHENLYSPNIYMDGHGDIDILTADSRKLVDDLGLISAHSNSCYGDGVHYTTKIYGRSVDIDLRQPGDGYYCDKWQRDMLQRRIFVNGYYALSATDYFYSLIYHSIFQKEKLSDDYRARLTKMAAELGIDTSEYSERQWVRLLESFMRSNEYKYTYCTDIHVPLYKRWIDRSLTDINRRLALEHLRYAFKLKCIDYAVKVKHTLRL